MEVKKFEAPTIQEALENVKRELGSEAIILQTKKNKFGFGLLSKSSVEITAAISDNDFKKKGYKEENLIEKKHGFNVYKEEYETNFFEKNNEKKINIPLKERLDLKSKYIIDKKKITATRYVDIKDNFKNKISNLDHLDQSISKKNELSVDSEKNNHIYDLLQQEVVSLKMMIEDIKKKQDLFFNEESNYKEYLKQESFLKSDSFTNSIKDSFYKLILSGIERTLALKLLKKVAFNIDKKEPLDSDEISNILAYELMNQVQVISVLDSKKNNLEQPLIFSIVGPTGSGKTTTIAKLAGIAMVKFHLKVGLINFDNFKIASFDQLRLYSKIVNAPFRSALSSDDLDAAILDFKNFDLILIDTPGKSYKDSEFLTKIEVVLSKIKNLKTLLVASANIRDIELYEIGLRFSCFNPIGTIITKLDESKLFGSVYNLTKKTGIPIAYFTTGQLIPDDIEEATKERLAALILDI